MPRKTKTAVAAGAALPSVPNELIDHFVTGPMSAEAVNDISMAFKRALIERALGAELSHQLGYRPGAAKPDEATNHRNGSTGKTVLTDTGALRIEVPRDREGKSARWAAKALKDLGVAEDKVRRIGKLIRATRHMSPSATARAVRVDGPDLMLDIDLATLGSDRARFEEHERQVRLEYGHVADEVFARTRADFVEALLGASPLYRTEQARSELEARARENLLRSLRIWRQA